MSATPWLPVDTYLIDILVRPDPVMDSVLTESAAAGLPPHHIPPTQGKLLYLLAKVLNAKNILEIGTLGGYSTIWFARALPADGKIITIEAEADHFEVAKNNIASAGMSDRVEQRLGNATTILPLIDQEKRAPFDLIFIDADKPNCTLYFEWAVKFSRPGTLIIVDNVIRSGTVIDTRSTSPGVHGIRKVLEHMATDRRVESTALQTVSMKGYDGFAIARVL